MENAKKPITNLSGSDSNVRTCEVCANEYDKCFEVHMHGETHVFDSFECAIHALAPECAHCGCRIVGHGMEVGDLFFCCAHCASEYGGFHLKDRIEVELERSPV